MLWAAEIRLLFFSLLALVPALISQSCKARQASERTPRRATLWSNKETDQHPQNLSRKRQSAASRRSAHLFFENLSPFLPEVTFKNISIKGRLDNGDLYLKVRSEVCISCQFFSQSRTQPFSRPIRTFTLCLNRAGQIDREVRHSIDLKEGSARKLIDQCYREAATETD